MKNLILVLCFLYTGAVSFGQDKDYIVREGNDTTYCKIKRITGSRIYFIYNSKERLYNELSDVLGYKRGDEEWVYPEMEKDSIIDRSQESMAKNTIYLELLGNGLWASLNYDRSFFYKKNYIISGSMGGLYFPVHFSIPLSINLLLSGFQYLQSPNHIEMGLGISYVYDEGIFSGYSVKNNYSSLLYGTTRIGYRYQKTLGGFFLKFGIIVFIPIIQLNENLPSEVSKEWGNLDSFPSIGLGIGYTLIQK